MNMDMGVELLWFVLAFTLVISAVVAHRIPFGTMARMALAWAGIIALAFLVIWGWQLTQ
jgi:cytochrome c biogenesis protein CcdA